MFYFVIYYVVFFLKHRASFEALVKKMWKFTLLPVQESFRSATMLRAPCVCMDVYVTIGNPDFCLFLDLTGLHFRGELQHGGDECQQKIKCRPIITREICGVLLSVVLYANTFFTWHLLCNRFSLTVIRLGLEDSFWGGGAKQGQFYPPPSCFKKK